MTPILEVKDLRKEFHLHILNGKRLSALRDLSFSIIPGEVVGLTGSSGSGKSTLMKCIYRTYLAHSGSIFYDSALFGRVDLATAPEHQVLRLRRTEMTYCSQFLSVIPRVSALDIVAESLENRGVARDEALERAREFLSGLGLHRELWDAYPATFSGGEQQRINIARAIIARPRFLLVDEPTASLDQKAKDVVIERILQLREHGTSVVLISHDRYALDRMSSRFLHLESGQVREQAAV